MSADVSLKRPVFRPADGLSADHGSLLKQSLLRSRAALGMREVQVSEKNRKEVNLSNSALHALYLCEL